MMYILLGYHNEHSLKTCFQVELLLFLLVCQKKWFIVVSSSWPDICTSFFFYLRWGNIHLLKPEVMFASLTLFCVVCVGRLQDEVNFSENFSSSCQHHLQICLDFAPGGLWSLPLNRLRSKVKRIFTFFPIFLAKWKGSRLGCHLLVLLCTFKTCPSKLYIQNFSSGFHLKCLSCNFQFGEPITSPDITLVFTKIVDLEDDWDYFVDFCSVLVSVKFLLCWGVLRWRSG